MQIIIIITKNKQKLVKYTIKTDVNIICKNEKINLKHKIYKF